MEVRSLKKGIRIFGHEIIRIKRTDAVRNRLNSLSEHLAKANSSARTLTKELERSNSTAEQLRKQTNQLHKQVEKMQSELAKLRECNKEIPNLMDLALVAAGCQEKSEAQLKQDIFVLLQTKFKTGGFFVEFGATNGLGLSNTYLLEKSFGWTGILAEPAPMWHDDLKKNRNASLDFDCVWTKTGETLEFNMANEGELSTLNSFSNSDHHAETRKAGEIISVQTVSLNDLLERHNAPRKIDYLSIDTEGSEYEILKNFDFSKYDIDIITCEHNFTKMGDEVFELLSKHGYKRVFEGTSKWDHWYVRS